MSYNPTNWQAGDTVTSAKLNKIEQGIKNNILVANLIYDDQENGIMHVDKTWQEIYDADFCIVNITLDDGTITTSFVVVKSPGDEKDSVYYAIVLFSPASTEGHTFLAATPNDYPVLNNQQPALDPGPGSKEAN